MRRKNVLCILLMAAVNYCTAFTSTAQENDPDVPRFVRGISKEEYMKLRAAYLEERTGNPEKFLYNPRRKAIEEMKQKELLQRTNRFSRMASPPWIQLGPSPIPNGQTTLVSVPVSGRVSAIAVHPTNENIVYIGTANGGVYRSMNGGLNWTPIFDDAQSLAIGALALAPSNPSILYVGTGEPQLSADAFAGVGLYRIDNADAAATLVGPINPLMTYSTGSGSFTSRAFGYRAISKIIVHPTDPATIFVSTTSGTSSNPSAGVPNTLPEVGILGLFRSTNATSAAGSVTFTKLSVTNLNSIDVPGTGQSMITDVVVDPTDPNTMLCWVYESIVSSTTQGGGVYRSTNALAATPSFTKVYSNTLGFSRGELAIAKVDGNLIAYAGTGENGGNGRLLRSVNGGVTWTNAPGTTAFCSGQCFYDIAIAVDPTNVAKVFIGGSSGTNIFRRSLDSINTVPTSIGTALHADVHSIVVAPSNPNTIYLGCDGGIYKSIDGASTWTSMNTAGLHATQFQSIALHPTDPNFTIGGTQDNGTNMLTPAGTFNRIDFGDGGYALIDQNATDLANVTMYHTYFNSSTLSGFARVDNVASAGDGLWPFYGCNGSSGNGITCPPNNSSVLFYAPIALGPGNPNTVYYGNTILYRSANKGVLNTAVSQTMTSVYTTISVSPQDDNYRIAGLRDGKVYATISGSSTLIDVTPPLTSLRAVGRVFIHPSNKNIAYVTYVGYGIPAGQHIWKTTNLNNLGGSGVTWTAAGNGLPDVPVNCFTSPQTNPNLLFCGTDVGVFASEDAGANWVPYNTGLPVVPVFDMAIHKVSNVLRIATHGRGFWQTAAFPLPVTFTEFTASVKSRTNVLLEWFTATETNNKGFEVQRAVANGIRTSSWETIGFVKGSGTTSSPRRYELEDVPVGGKKFIYRLRQVDYDNNNKFSEQRQVTLGDYDFALFPVYPNPAKGNATIRYQLPESGYAALQIHSSSGALVKTIFNDNKEAGIYQASISTVGLAAGTYYISLKSGIYYNTKMFIVQ